MPGALRSGGAGRPDRDGLESIQSVTMVRHGAGGVASAVFPSPGGLGAKSGGGRAIQTRGAVHSATFRSSPGHRGAALPNPARLDARPPAVCAVEGCRCPGVLSSTSAGARLEARSQAAYRRATVGRLWGLPPSNRKLCLALAAWPPLPSIPPTPPETGFSGIPEAAYGWPTTPAFRRRLPSSLLRSPMQWPLSAERATPPSASAPPP